jgi:hypothetical protein
VRRNREKRNARLKVNAGGGLFVGFTFDVIRKLKL